MPNTSFTVTTTKGDRQTFERWTDALDAAKALMPQCKGLFQDVRILEGNDVVWVYSRSHKYPMYMGPRSYDRLAKRFILEAMEEQAALEGASDETATEEERSPQSSRELASPGAIAPTAETDLEQAKLAERQAIARKMLAAGAEREFIQQITGFSAEALSSLEAEVAGEKP